MQKVDVRVKRTYNQLFEALIKLLTQKSFDDITVLEICETASVHRATFYKHFVDKYDFLNECFKLKLSEFILDALGKEFIYDAAGMKTSCMNMVNSVLNFIVVNKNVFKYVCGDKYSIVFNNSIIDAMSNFIVERIQAVPEVSAKLGKQVYMLANYYAGAIVALIKWWLYDDDPCPVQDLLDFAEVKIDNLCDYFTSAIS